MACRDTVRFESALGSFCCQAGMTDVASSKLDDSAGKPFPELGAAGACDGQATSVALTSGAAACGIDCIEEADTGSGSGCGSGAAGASKAERAATSAPAIAGSGSGSGSASGCGSGVG